MSFFRQFPKTQYDFFNRGVNYEITDFFRYVTGDIKLLDDVSVYSYYRVQNGERPDVVSMKLYGTPEYYWTFFVINDHLKCGIATWPLSPEAFEDYMKEEYDGYAISSKVNVRVNEDGERLETTTLADEFPIGTPVIATHVPEGTNTSITTSTGGVVYARNPQLYQLIIKGDIVKTSGSHLTPFVATGKIKSDKNEMSIEQWTEFRNAVHHYEDSEGNLTYDPYYFDPDETEGKVENLGPLTAISNYEYESNLNDARADIRIIKPSLINQFAHQYRTLINAN